MGKGMFKCTFKYTFTGHSTLLDPLERYTWPSTYT